MEIPYSICELELSMNFNLSIFTNKTKTFKIHRFGSPGHLVYQLPLSSLAVACAPICWGELWWPHMGSLSLCLSRTHLTQSMELLFWGQNVSISYPHFGFAYYSSVVLILSSWVADFSQHHNENGRNKRNICRALPRYPFSFHSSHHTAKQTPQACV